MISLGSDKMNIKYISISALLLVTTLAPAAASAQQKTCKAPNDRQLTANKAGAQAMQSGNMEAAASIFKKSIQDDGDLNVTYLNLGRALQKAGKCAEAADAYQRALETNRCVPSPNPEKVRELTAQYRVELEATCPGQITLSCSPATMMVRIGDLAPQACSEFKEPVPVKPGSVEVVGELQGQTVRQVIEVRPIVTTPVALSIAVVGPPPEDKLVNKDDKKPDDALVVKDPGNPEPVDGDATWGWVQVGAGAALIIVSVIVDNVPESADNGSIDPLDFAPLGGYLVGGFLVANGLRMAF